MNSPHMAQRGNIGYIECDNHNQRKRKYEELKTKSC